MNAPVSFADCAPTRRRGRRLGSFNPITGFHRFFFFFFFFFPFLRPASFDGGSTRESCDWTSQRPVIVAWIFFFSFFFPSLLFFFWFVRNLRYQNIRTRYAYIYTGESFYGTSRLNYYFIFSCCRSFRRIDETILIESGRIIIRGNFREEIRIFDSRSWKRSFEAKRIGVGEKWEKKNYWDISKQIHARDVIPLRFNESAEISAWIRKGDRPRSNSCR